MQGAPYRKKDSQSVPMVVRCGNRMKTQLHLVLPLVLGACFPKSAPVPGPVTAEAAKSASAKYPGVTESELAEGRTLFTANCNKCHNYPDVNSKHEGEWPHILDEMAQKAKLSNADRDKVLHFVLASRSEP